MNNLMNNTLWFHLVEILITLTAAGFSVAYYVKWHNGKRWVRIVTVMIMLYFAIIHSLVLFGILDNATYDFLYIRPIMPLLYAIPCADVIVDWRRNTLNFADHFKSELHPLIKVDSSYVKHKHKNNVKKRKL